MNKKALDREELTKKIEWNWLNLYEAVDARDLKKVFKIAFSIKNYQKQRDIIYESPQS